MTTIYFVRHCEGEGNACRRSQTLYDGLVTTKGLAQTEALRERFHSIHIDSVYSSDAYRARVTADAVAADHGLNTRYRVLLREYAVGIWDGTANGNVPILFPEYMKHNAEHPGELRFPGGDTYESIECRAAEVLKRILAENRGKTVVVVSHALMLRVLLCYVSAIGRDRINEIEYGDNTAVSLVVADDDITPRVEYVADDSHLSADLRRIWTGVPSSQLNMEVQLCELPRDGHRLLEFSRLMHKANGDEKPDDEKLLEHAGRRIAQNADYVSFFCLGGETKGILFMHELSGEYTAVEGFYMDDELRRKEYDLQLLGHAIHSARKENRRYIAFPTPKNELDRALVERFQFEAIPGRTDYVRLRLTPPACEGPII